MRSVLFGIVVGLVGVSILVSLGVWQVQRLAWKQGILAEIDYRMAQPPQPLPASPDPDRDAYAPVQVVGTILPGELHVLVSRKNIGAGYRIIVPFLTAQGQRIMVDRGFARAADKDAPRRLGPIELTGNLHWPQEVDGYTPAPDRAGNVWFARDVPAMAAALDTAALLIVAASQSDPGVTPMPVDTRAIPNDHLQYAITWFSLALIWGAMTTYFLWRARRARKPDVRQ